MTYAIVETGGKQYRAAVGDIIQVEKLEAEEDVSFDHVLLVKREDGKIDVGTPDVSGVVVKGKVVEQGKGPKIRGFKYKPKVNYRKRYGHRQPFTAVRIEAIEG